MPFKILDEHHYVDHMHNIVMPALESCRYDGWLEPSDDSRLPKLKNLDRLHYAVFDYVTFALHESKTYVHRSMPSISQEQQRYFHEALAKEYRGCIVISHGFTESIIKYYELIYYFLCSGYSVCIMDHRGHGLSPRDVADSHIVWIDDWHRYIADFNKFTQEVAKPIAGRQSLLLFAHSMGGGIGAAMLEQYPQLFDAAVLSSPMLEVNTGMPHWMVTTWSKLAIVSGYGEHRIPQQRDFAATFATSEYGSGSLPRAQWYHALRVSDSRYHTSAASYGWMLQAENLCSSVLRETRCSMITTPVRLFQAESDTFVMSKQQQQFIHQIQRAGGIASLQRIADARHELFMETNDIFEPYLRDVLNFFQGK